MTQSIGTTSIKKSALMVAVLSASANAMAQNQPPIEEIVVTAQKREESLQEVPLAVSVVSSKELADRSVINIDEALALVPNLAVESNLSINPRIAIRGVSTSTNNIGLESGVGMQIDGVPFGRPSYMSTAIMDLEQIEVLRGPQGTLYGKNTTGGLINIVSGRPRMEFGGAADLTLGSYGLQQLRGHVTRSLGSSGKTAGRLAVAATQNDGWAEDRNPENDDFQSQDFRGIRGHVLHQPNDDIEVLISAIYSDEDSIQNFQAGPLFALDGDGQDRSIATNERNQTTREVGGLYANVSYALNDQLTVYSTTGYLYNDSEFFTDQDYTQLDILATRRREEQSQFSQEIRLVSSADGSYDWTLGAYYFNQGQDGRDRASLGPDVLPAVGVPFEVPDYEDGAVTLSNIDTESIAAFAAGSWYLSEEWTLSAGLRVTREEKTLDYQQTLELYEIAPGQPLGIIFAFAAPVSPSQQNLTDTEPSGDLSLRYTPSETLSIYARYSRGFKAGGFDSTLSAVSDPGDLSFAPEFVDSIELGAKSLMLDGRVILNLAAFHLDWSDKQEQDFNGIIFLTSNAASASNAGIEAELTLNASDNLRLFTSLGVQDGSYDTFSVSSPSGTDDRSGNALVDTPDLTASVAGDYNVTLSSGWQLFWRGEAIYRDENFTESGNDSRFQQGARTLVNTRLGVSSPSGRFSLHLWGKNLLDEDYIVTGFEFLGTEYAALSAPTTWGIELSTRW